MYVNVYTSKPMNYLLLIAMAFTGCKSDTTKRTQTETVATCEAGLHRAAQRGGPKLGD